MRLRYGHYSNTREFPPLPTNDVEAASFIDVTAFTDPYIRTSARHLVPGPGTSLAPPHVAKNYEAKTCECFRLCNLLRNGLEFANKCPLVLDSILHKSCKHL
jgi:hypothetical protein